MGVVHKLRDDVRDFILAEKKAFPQISCRKLSDIVYEKFQIVISKSSVSSVLQSANLSSPIGRHSLSVDEDPSFTKNPIKKFKIPEQKKSQIFSVASTDPIITPPKIIKTEVNKPVIVPIAPPKSVVAHSPIKEVPIPTMPAVPEMSNLKEKPKDKVIPQVLQPKGSLVQNAGMIFLKAAEWNLAGTSILGKILKDELGGRLNADFEQIGDVLLLSKTTENKDVQNSDFSTWKWLIDFSRLTREEDPAMQASVLTALGDIDNCGMKLSIEVEILLQGVAYIKILNQDGTVIYMDAKSKSISFDNVQSAGEISFAEAIRMVNNEIIRNVHSAVFHCPPIVNNIEKLTKSVLAAFSNANSERMKEISLFNAQNVELVKYNYCPAKERIFVLVMRSWEKIIPRVSDDLRVGEAFASLNIMDKTFFYKKCSNLLMPRVHVIAVSHSPTEKPFAVLLTNAAGDLEAIKKAVSDFLLNSSSLAGDLELSLLISEHKREEQIAFAKEALNLLDQSPSLSEGILALRKVFKALSQQYFFTANETFLDGKENNEQIYSLPGVLLEEERALSLSFFLSTNDPTFPALKTAVERFNNRVIFDPRGQRVILKVNAPAAV